MEQKGEIKMKGLFFVLLSVSLGLVAERYGASFWLILAAAASGTLGVFEWVLDARRTGRGTRP